MTKMMTKIIIIERREQRRENPLMHDSFIDSCHI